MIAHRLRPLRLVCGLFSGRSARKNSWLRSCQPFEIFVVQQPGRHARVRWKLCSRIIPVTPKAAVKRMTPVIIGVVCAVPADARLRRLQRSHRLMDALRQLGS